MTLKKLQSLFVNGFEFQAITQSLLFFVQGANE